MEIKTEPEDSCFKNNFFEAKEIKQEPYEIDEDIENKEKVQQKIQDIKKEPFQYKKEVNIKNEIIDYYSTENYLNNSEYSNENVKKEEIFIKKQVHDNIKLDIKEDIETDEVCSSNKNESHEFINNLNKSVENIKKEINNLEKTSKQIELDLICSNKPNFNEENLGYTTEDRTIEVYGVTASQQYSQVIKKMYVCTECKHESVTKKSIETHIQTHLHLYVCKMCNGKFTNAIGLKNHIVRIHVNKRHKCKICPYKTNKKYELERHSSKHFLSESRTRKCFKCVFETTDESVWKTHIANHLELKCVLCAREYKSKFQYNLHIRYKHSEHEQKFLMQLN